MVKIENTVVIYLQLQMSQSLCAVAEAIVIKKDMVKIGKKERWSSLFSPSNVPNLCASAEATVTQTMGYGENREYGSNLLFATSNVSISLCCGRSYYHKKGHGENREKRRTDRCYSHLQMSLILVLRQRLLGPKQ